VEVKGSDIQQLVGHLFRHEAGRMAAVLTRFLGADQMEIAEDFVQDTLLKAMEVWPYHGIPENPSAWLYKVAKNKTIDYLRTSQRRNKIQLELQVELRSEWGLSSSVNQLFMEDEIQDSVLRMMFACCHPAIPQESQIALTLKTLGGLSTLEIAHAFLTAAPTLAQRIVRAKNKIRDAKIPYQVPSPEDLPDRLESVLRVIYLVFNEGYAASSGDSLTRHDLSGEAIRLVRLLAELLPESEALGLFALLLLHESRRAARVSATGDLILLDDQDRSLWDRSMIADGRALVERAMSSRRIGPYTLQAAIAAVHAEASSAAATDWSQIVGLYDVLVRAEPSPVVELNRAVAVAMRDGPEAGLALVDAILARGDLADYRFAHAARADLCRRLGKTAEARSAYQRALELTRLEPERRFLERRLAELQKP